MFVLASGSRERKCCLLLRGSAAAARCPLFRSILGSGGRAKVEHLTWRRERERESAVSAHCKSKGERTRLTVQCVCMLHVCVQWTELNPLPYSCLLFLLSLFFFSSRVLLLSAWPVLSLSSYYGSSGSTGGDAHYMKKKKREKEKEERKKKAIVPLYRC